MLADFVDNPRLTFTINQSYGRGQSTSVIAGLSAVSSGSAGAMFLVGDQPLLNCLAIDRLIAAFEASGGGICYPSCDGRRCNPVIFDAVFFHELRQLSGDSGGRAVIDANSDAVIPVAFSDESLFYDVDRPADIEDLLPQDVASGSAVGGSSFVQAFELKRSRVISLCGSGGKTSLMSALVRELASNGDERILATTTTKMGSDEIKGPWRACQADDAAGILALANDYTRPVLAYHRFDHDRLRLHGFPSDVIDELARSGRFTRIVVEADGSRRRPLKAPKSGEPVFPAATDMVVAVAGLSGLGRPLNDDAVFRPDHWSALTGLTASNPVTAESLARIIVHPNGLMRGMPPQARRILFLNQADSPDQMALANIALDCLPMLGGQVPERAVVGRLQPEPLIYVIRDFSTRATLNLGEGR